MSKAVVGEMAQGALKKTDADYAVAISGIAGPDGGTLEKPVGTVWFAWASVEGELISECIQFDGDRQKVREQAVKKSLQGLLHLIPNTD